MRFCFETSAWSWKLLRRPPVSQLHCCTAVAATTSSSSHLPTYSVKYMIARLLRLAVLGMHGLC